MTASAKEWCIAIHEAAHAVIGIDQGLTIDRAELIRDGGGSVVCGATHAPTVPVITPGNATPSEIVECSKLAREILAGMFAEWKLEICGDPGVKGDIKQLSDLTSTMFCDQERASAFTLQINNEMSALIDARWDAIRAVACNLLLKEQSRAEIEQEMEIHPAMHSTPAARHAGSRLAVSGEA